MAVKDERSWIKVSFTLDEFERVLAALKIAKHDYENQAAGNETPIMTFQDYANQLGDIIARLDPMLPPEEEEDYGHWHV